ncbi:LPXTG cell wall anchor domain-containing protein [Enterococcus sp. UD-01]|jgi:LPXTG-motif cell wall-anchored protein|uniref:LPXTG cell wall anchor domain-containing protein n=1 Tax=Enterococcus sp. UD-01 TaxID=3373911 RepID=UPI003836379C
MKKSIINLILSFTFVFLLANARPLTAAAGTNGGEVQTNGVISFYEDSSTIESSSTSEPRQTSDEPIAKPKGNYPTTGEMVKTSLIYTGVILVIIAGLLFFWKQKKNQEGRDDK